MTYHRFSLIITLLAVCISLAAYPVIELDKLLRQPIEDSYELVETIPLDASYSSVCLSAPSRTSVGYPMYALQRREMGSNGDRILAIFTQTGLKKGTIAIPNDKLESWWQEGDIYQQTPWDDYSDQGVKIEYSENKQYLLWVNRSGQEVGRMPQSHYYNGASSFGNGNYWLIEEAGYIIEEAESACDDLSELDEPEDGYLIDSYFPSHYGFIITDGNGNKLFECELTECISCFLPSPTGNVIWIQAGNKNMFLSMNNQVIHNIPGASVILPVAFSPSGDVAFIGRPFNRVIDLVTGEILAEVKNAWNELNVHISISDKDAGLVASYFHDDLYVIDYVNMRIVQRFDRGTQTQFSGDGRDFCLIDYKSNYYARYRKGS